MVLFGHGRSFSSTGDWNDTTSAVEVPIPTPATVVLHEDVGWTGSSLTGYGWLFLTPYAWNDRAWSVETYKPLLSHCPNRIELLVRRTPARGLPVTKSDPRRGQPAASIWGGELRRQQLRA